MNRYVLKLVDEYGDIKEQIYIAETEKTLREVVDVYNKAHEEWYEDNADFDCLSAHIEMRLNEQGITFKPLDVDATLEF